MSAPLGEDDFSFRSTRRGTRDPKCLGGSWWIEASPQGFTDLATQLWEARQPDSSMAGVTMQTSSRHGVLNGTPKAKDAA